jgi:hypothetical protein
LIVVAAVVAVEGALGTTSYIVGYLLAFEALAEALGPNTSSTVCELLVPGPDIFSAAFVDFAEFEASAAFVFAAFVGFAEFQASAAFAAFVGFAEFEASAEVQAFKGFHAEASAAWFAFAFFAAFIAFMITLLGVMFLDCTRLESSFVASVDAASAPMERRSILLFML